jgi:hypothetical protein
VHSYSKNTKENIDIFNLNGGPSIWWVELKEVKGLNERNLTWKQFKKYFRKACLLEKYYESKIEFHEHKLGKITIVS